jgi:hypothetical protein
MYFCFVPKSVECFLFFLFFFFLFFITLYLLPPNFSLLVWWSCDSRRPEKILAAHYSIFVPLSFPSRCRLSIMDADLFFSAKTFSDLGLVFRRLQCPCVLFISYPRFIFLRCFCTARAYMSVSSSRNPQKFFVLLFVFEPGSCSQPAGSLDGVEAF